MRYDISVIIPMFNAEDFIELTLESVKSQTFEGSIEIICIDDCSTDSTLEIVEQFKENTSNPMRILKQEKNMRQGTARNRGLLEAKGKYVFFLDSDDFLDKHALKEMYNKAECDNCDFVICDWVYCYEGGKEVYVNNDLFMFDELLTGQDCERLFQADSYFTVNKLYDRSFLIKNNITYGEGYIYEDLEFYINVVQNADRIGVISNPFYKIRVNEDSTTKTNYKTTIHMDDYLKALQNTLLIFNPRHKLSYYMTYKYFLYRAMLYAERRVPKKYKRLMITQVVFLLNNKETEYEVPNNIVLFNKLYFTERLLQNEKINTILFVRYFHKKGKLNSFYNVYSKITTLMEKLKRSKINKRRRIRAMNKIKRASQDSPLNHQVLFLGFDYRYIGNSKYLYDYITEYHPEINVKMVTNDKRVPIEHRIQPRSAAFWKALGSSKIIVTESWTPLAFYKKEGALWIQLWHGTPYKKMFFDSHEKYISKYNRNHKRLKKRDIEKWDVLIADSRGAVDLFSSAFSIQKNKIFAVGYPRVQWLIEQQQNEQLKQKLYNQLSIRPDQTVLLYAPTWRDYNYKRPNPDMNYLMDVSSLMSYLGDDYVLITKTHGMEKGIVSQSNIKRAPHDIETQELLLITDTVISDYSSIIFDVLPNRKKIAVFTKDRMKFNEARGTYDEIDRLLEPFTFENEEALAQFIRSPMTEDVRKYYEKLLHHYGNAFPKNSNDEIVNIITAHQKGEFFNTHLH